MVGSILGTFLTGFFLIDVLGTKGVLLLLGDRAGVRGDRRSARSGTPPGRASRWASASSPSCPSPGSRSMGDDWGIREEQGDPATTEDALAWVDESNYYYIKVDQRARRRRPEADPRPRQPDPRLLHPRTTPSGSTTTTSTSTPWSPTASPAAKAKARGQGRARPGRRSKTLFLGGGAYTFQRYMQHTYPGTDGRRRRDRPGRHQRQPQGARPARATRRSRPPGATPASSSSGTRTSKQYDLIFGDAFNDFSVPWHLTTREFNEKIAKMLSPDGVYMINIIDVYESDAKAAQEGREDDRRARTITDPRPAGARSSARSSTAAHELRRLPRRLGQDGQADLPAHLHLRDRRQPRRRPPRDVRRGRLEAAARPRRPRPAATTTPSSSTTTASPSPAPYGPEDEKAVIDVRSRGIILTDDYAPVENLLAPVAATRGDD